MFFDFGTRSCAVREGGRVEISCSPSRKHKLEFQSWQRTVKSKSKYASLEIRANVPWGKLVTLPFTMCRSRFFFFFLKLSGRLLFL